jgi:hypothetical protein
MTSGITKIGPVVKTSVIGAYGVELLEGCFGTEEDHIKYKNMSGYELKVGMTANISTGGGNCGRIYLNDCLMVERSTWSINTFRVIPHPIKLYTLSEIGQEATKGYSSNGINMYVQNTGDSWCWIDKATIHGYLVSKKIHYQWERVL